MSRTRPAIWPFPLLNPYPLRNMKKVRIIALYIMFRDGVPDEDRRRLYQHARLTLAEQDAVNALVHLGGRLLRVSRLLHALLSR